MSDAAYKMLESREYPGGGYSVVNGATTVWEHWDSYTEAEGIKKGMNSFNHYSFGSCTEWMFEYCLGIRPSDVGGFDEITLAPCFDFDGTITSACGHYDSPRGRISVSWKRECSTVTYEVTLPVSIKYSTDFEGTTLLSEQKQGERLVFVLKKA